MEIRKIVSALSLALLLTIPVAMADTYGDSEPDFFFHSEPGSALYGLEKFGEGIQRFLTFSEEGKMEWDGARVVERTQEFRHMVEREPEGDHLRLMNEARNRLQDMTERMNDNKGLQMAVQAQETHMRILRDVENRVPPEAKDAIRRAIQNSERAQEQLENIERDGDFERPVDVEEIRRGGRP